MFAIPWTATETGAPNRDMNTFGNIAGFEATYLMFAVAWILTLKNGPKGKGRFAYRAALKCGGKRQPVELWERR